MIMRSFTLSGILVMLSFSITPLVVTPTVIPAVAAEPSESAETPAWTQLSLTNVNTGESFKLADFEGKTVLVETMATWCSNCRTQLGNVKEARTLLGDLDDVVFVALSVEQNLSDEALATYAQNQGFDWIFAVATPDMIRALTEQFGRTVTSPPATPHFLIQADGSISELSTGFTDPEAIVEEIQAAQS